MNIKKVTEWLALIVLMCVFDGVQAAAQDKQRELELKCVSLEGIGKGVQKSPYLHGIALKSLANARADWAACKAKENELRPNQVAGESDAVKAAGPLQGEE
jgi:hypothetical protein